MKIIKYILILLFIIELISCEKTISFKVSDNNLLVVNSLISPADPIQLKLSQSINITDNDTVRYINDAVIGIFCNNVFKENLNCFGNGLYKSSFVPEQDNEYKIEVISEGLTNVTAKTIIPLKPEIIAAIADSFLFNGFNIRIKITINDNAIFKNFYYLTFKSYVIDYDYTKFDSITNDYVIRGENFSDLLFINNDQTLSGKEGSSSKETIQAILGTTETGLDVINWLAFSDQNINGLTHTIEIYIAESNIRPSPIKPIYVELKSISEDYFKYLRSKEYSKKTGNNPFTEPIHVYNNIEGGVGIFAGFNMALDSVVPSKK
jgi:hypothetical protein